MCAMTWLRSTVVRHRRLAAAEGQQLLRQRRRAIGGAAHFDRGGVQRGVRRRFLDQLVAVAEQHGDQVVEVVRDAGGEAADGLHLLRLAQLGLEPIALAEVARDRGDADDLAVADQHARVHVDRHAGCPCAARTPTRNARGALSAPSAIICDDRVEVVGAEDPVRIEHPQLVAQVAGDLLAAAVDRRDAAAAIVDDHDLARAIEQVVEPRLQRDFARQLAADGFFLRRGCGGSSTAAAPIDDGGKRGDEPDPPGRADKFGKGHDVSAVEGRLYHETRDEHYSAALRTTLPARAYTDPAWFAVEMDRVFARMWLAAGRADQLDHAGAFIRRDVAGASVLIVRAADGSIRAHHNVCRHRGTRLCIEEHGTFQGSIQCPYHAWTYGLDGRLLAAPQMDEVDGFDRSRVSAARRSRARRGTATSSSTCPTRPTPLAGAARRAAGALRAVGACRTFASRIASSTTSPPTGSSWSRTTTSACTAR